MPERVQARELGPRIEHADRPPLRFMGGLDRAISPAASGTFAEMAGSSPAPTRMYAIDGSRTSKRRAKGLTPWRASVYPTTVTVWLRAQRCPDQAAGGCSGAVGVGGAGVRRRSAMNWSNSALSLAKRRRSRKLEKSFCSSSRRRRVSARYSSNAWLPLDGGCCWLPPPLPPPAFHQRPHGAQDCQVLPLPWPLLLWALLPSLGWPQPWRHRRPPQPKRPDATIYTRKARPSGQKRIRPRWPAASRNTIAAMAMGLPM